MPASPQEYAVSPARTRDRAQQSSLCCRRWGVADTPSGRLAIHQLEDAPAGGLVWKAGGLERVGAALREDLLGPLAPKAVDELLRLMSVVRNKHASPAAADALGALLRAHPAACKIVRGKVVPSGGIDRVRDFASSEGRAAPLRAPTPSAKVPTGALPLRALLDPASADRARARTTKTRKDP